MPNCPILFPFYVPLALQSLEAARVSRARLIVSSEYLKMSSVTTGFLALPFVSWRKSQLGRLKSPSFKPEGHRFRLANVSYGIRMPNCCRRESLDFDERSSPSEVKKEIEQCYELIHRLGRGVVYLGSARVESSRPNYLLAFELAKEVAQLLDCTSWSGAGPGLMDAVTKGALQAGKPVGGIKIEREAGQWTSTNIHPYLPSTTYLTCRFFSARKHGLVDAAIRTSRSDRTAVVALPGGVGTLDEMFEILALIQLERIGTEFPVPFILMNYSSFYSKLLDFLDDCAVRGTVAKGEVDVLWKVCNSNSEALAYLAEFYGLSLQDQSLQEKETGRTN